MANKRMFTMKICDSDAFLDMPLSSQCLYFHLNMRADDDGFVGNPKRIMRIIGASAEDLEVLIENRFILTFEDGVIVIKHWRMHNTLSTNRYHETQYVDEKNMLRVKENGAYSFNAGDVIDDSKLIEKSGRLSKKQMEKRRNFDATLTHPDIDKGLDIDIDKEKESEKAAGKKECQEIADMYNEICVSFPRCTVLSDKRKTLIKSRLKTYSVDDFRNMFQKAEASEFLKGNNQRNWRATFDWMLNDSNMAKIIDGNYANLNKNVEEKEQKPTNGFHNFKERNNDYAALESKLLGYGN